MFICHLDRSALIQRSTITERELSYLYTSKEWSKLSTEKSIFVLLICLHFTVVGLHRSNKSCDLNVLTCRNRPLTSTRPILCTEQNSTYSSLQSAQISSKTEILFIHLEYVKSKANATWRCINQIKSQMESSFKGQRCASLNSAQFLDQC